MLNSPVEGVPPATNRTVLAFDDPLLSTRLKQRCLVVPAKVLAPAESAKTPVLKSKVDVALVATTRTVARLLGSLALAGMSQRACSRIGPKQGLFEARTSLSNSVESVSVVGLVVRVTVGIQGRWTLAA